MSKPGRLFAVTLLGLVASYGTPTSFAQLPKPKLTSLSRLGVATGESVDVTLRGTDLEGVNQLWFDHPGLRAFHVKDLTFRVAAAQGVPIGQHDVRAIGTYGASNPRTFEVGGRPESVEVEPNNLPEQANAIAINSVVNGEIAATDIDCLGFQGKAGQRLWIDLAALRLEGRLDATLRVFGPDGRELVENRDARDSDPFLDLTLPTDGRYVIKVHDVTYTGSVEHGYRLTLSDGPWVDAIVPSVATPGVPTVFTVLGRNLGGTPAPELTIDGATLERKTLQLTVAGGDLNSAFPSLDFFDSGSAPKRGSEFTLDFPKGRANSFFVAEAKDPVVLEHEPNDDDEHVQALTLPCDVSGGFEAANDVDIYRFQAKKGETWCIEVDAERLGSRADPVFVVQKVIDKAAPQDLATGEDSPDQGGGPRFGLSSVDPSLVWQAPEDGTYQVVLSDLYSSQRGDPSLYYRLNLRPLRPDFRLFVVPEGAAGSDSVVIGAGGKAYASVIAWRTDGFAGPIRVEAESLPPGVFCQPVTIAAGQNVAPIVFEAAEGTAPSVGLARIIGRSRLGDRKDDLGYVSGVTPLGPEIVHEALGGGMIWPPASPTTAPTIAPSRVTRGIVVAVRPLSPLAISVPRDQLTVPQGHLHNLEVQVARRGEFTEAVALASADLPPTMVSNVATIDKASAKGILPLFIPKTVPAGIYTLTIRGTGPFPFSKDPNTKPKPNVNLSEPANPLTLVVRPAPVNLTVNNKGGSLKAGATLEVEITLARQAGFAEELGLALNAPAGAKLSAPTLTIPAGQAAAKLVITSAADSPVAAVAGAYIRASGKVRGELVEVDEPLALSITK